MRSVIMIAHDFPPEGNAGAHRPLRFVRHLPGLGWQPTVVTLDTNVYERYDPSLLKLVPDIKVIHVRNPDPWRAFQNTRRQRLKRQISSNALMASRIQEAQHKPRRALLRRLVRKAEAWSYHPDSAMGWIRPALKATLRICATKRPDVIWATAGPVSSFVVAQRASAKTGIPYVLDFRDAWTITYNEFEARQPLWAQRRAHKFMYRLLQGSRAVVFRYESEAECFWRAYPCALNDRKVHIIPNGFDGDVEPHKAPTVTNKCRILYTGTLGDYRYNTLLQALRILKDESPQLAKCLQLQFVGDDNQHLGEMTATLGLSDMIAISDSSTFAEVTQLSRDAHILLVLGRYSTMKGYELFAPAKLFGYMKMGRPILGVLPRDEARNILNQIGAPTVVDVDSIPEIITIMRHLVQMWECNRLDSLVPNIEACRLFAAVRQAVPLTRALEGKPAAKAFVPRIETLPPSLRTEIHARALEAQRLGYFRRPKYRDCFN